MTVEEKQLDSHAAPDPDRALPVIAPGQTSGTSPARSPPSPLLAANDSVARLVYRLRLCGLSFAGFFLDMPLSYLIGNGVGMLGNRNSRTPGAFRSRTSSGGSESAMPAR